MVKRVEHPFEQLLPYAASITTIASLVAVSIVSGNPIAISQLVPKLVLKLLLHLVELLVSTFHSSNFAVTKLLEPHTSKFTPEMEARVTVVGTYIEG